MALMSTPSRYLFIFLTKYASVPASDPVSCYYGFFFIFDSLSYLMELSLVYGLFQGAVFGFRGLS